MKFRLFVVAVLIAIVSVPAQAQGRRHRSSEFERAYNNTLDTLLGPLNGFSRGYGRDYGYYDQDYGYDYRYDRHRGGDKKTVAAVVGGVIGFVVGRATAPRPSQQFPRMAPHHEPTPQTPVAVASRGPQIVNLTGNRIFVGDPMTGQGFTMEPGQTGTIPTGTKLDAWRKSVDGMVPAAVTVENGVTIVR